MTELEKRLKHIEKTNAKRTENYRKLQQQADENFYKIQQREKNEYIKANLKKETQKRTNSNISIADNALNNYNTIKNAADNYVSQRNRNDENIKIFTKERNQAKSDSIVNDIYLKSYKQAKEDEYNDTISSLKKRKEVLKNKLGLVTLTNGNYSKNKALNSQIDDIDKKIKYITNNYQDDLFNESLNSVYANNGIIDENIKKYVSGQDIRLLKAEVEKNPQLMQQREALMKKLENDEKNSVDTKVDKIIKKYEENDKEHLAAHDYEEWLKTLDEKSETDKEALLLSKDNDNGTLFQRKLKEGMKLASEGINNSQDSINAIKLGAYDTKENDEDFSRLTSEDDKIRYYYLRGKYGKEEASKYVLYAVQQQNTIDGLKEAQENGTLEEFINAGKSGLIGAGKGALQAINGWFGGVGSNSVKPSDYDKIASASEVAFQSDANQSGVVKRFALNAVNTTANMLPSIGISFATGMPGLGMISQSVSAAGQAYNQALLEGKNNSEALTYGGIQGLMEFATQKILGGQFGMNGALEKFGTKALNNVMPRLVKNETFRTYAYQAGNILINSAGEFNEEAIQQLLEPYIRNVTFGENNKQTLQNVEDALYSGLLGLASAGMTNTAGAVATGTVNAVANKISDKKLSKAKNIYNAYQEQLLAEKQNENQTDNIEPPTVEAVFSETEASQEKAKRLTKTINKIDRGEKIADSEIVELKYNKTAADMLGQMAGLKEGKITSDFDNETVREVINQAQNGKKNIDTATILNNIRSNMQSNQNLVENSNENGSDEVLNADEGNLTNTNQMALQNATEPNMTSQIDEVSEAIPENLTADDETEDPNNNTYSDNVLDNFKSTFKRVVNNSNKIIKLGISSEKTGSTNIRKVESVENGVAQLLMTNGEVVPADTIDFSDNKNAEIILSNAGKYNSSTANTFILNYDSSKNTAENYSVAFNSVYRMAEKGLSMDTIASQTRGARAILGEKTFNAAINAGRNTANGTFVDNKNKVTSGVRKTDVSNQRTSQNKKVNINAKSETSRINIRQSAKSLSTALGVKINVYNSDTSVRGYEQNGEVFINESYVNSKANSASEFNFILAHELTHTLEQSNYYDQLKTFILNSRVYDDYLTSNDTTHKAEISKRQELYEKNGKELTKEEAERELIADFIADELLTNEECIRELAYKDKKLFAKVVDFIHKMIDNLKRFVRNSTEITAAQKDLIHIKELYTKAFNDVRKNGTYSNEVKYSKKLGGYNPDVRVTTEGIADKFDIKNINDLSEVQEKVYNKLLNNYVSTEAQSKPIINIDTGMKIEIWKSGIYETFGNHSAYRNIPSNMKKAKLATMTNLAKLIKYGEVRAKEQPNNYNPNSQSTYAYLTSPITIDGKKYIVNMDIKKVRQGNRFYIHKIKIADKVSRTDRSAFKSITLSANNNISQNDDIVNSNIRKKSKNDTQYSLDPDVESQMKTLNEQYGTKKKGENPVRDIDVPERSSKDKRVREFVKTILESGVLTDEMVNEVDKQIVKGAASYMPLSNEKALTIAKEWLDNKGKGVTEKQWNDWEIMKNRNHKVSAIDVAKGELLLRYAAQNNETKKVIQLTGELAEMATTAGQTVQAMRLLKKSSGIGKLYYIEQTVRRMNADYQAKYSNKLAKGKEIPQIKIDEDLALKLAQAKTQTEIEEAEIELNKDIGKQVPATWIDKWNAWRYMSMLFNSTTHIRNVVGNTIFMPAVSMKNGIAYGLEKAFLKGDIEKSKALKVKAAYKEFAKQDFDYVKAELTGNGKYESTDAIKANKVIFNNKKFEGLRNLNINLLEAEDGIFLKHHYERALGMYLQANNISLNELSDTKAENERQAAIDRGRVRAITEAQKATYRDASKIADALSRIAKSNWATEIVMEGIIPFKKTPVNIAKRAFEYSPLGLIKNVTKDIYNLKTGKITASEYIDRISAGLTGAGIYTLGLWLGSLGLLKVGLGDDKKEKDFEKLKGHQELSVEIFGYSYTFDWACPAAIPLFAGAKTHEILEGDNNGLAISDYLNLAGTMFDPMFEMSVLSGIENLINNIKYSESPIIAGMSNIVSSYLGQAVPTIGGKIASTVDGTRRNSYIDKSKDTFISKLLTSSQQQFVNRIIKKIPGATYLLEPYVNEWGEQEKENNIGMRIFENFISPGYVSKIEVDEAEKMLDDTYKNSGDPAVLPTKSKKYFSLGGKTINLNSDDYTTYATVRGQIAHSILSDFSKNSEFTSADSSDKATLITKSYELSNAIAKQGVSDYEPDGWIRSAIQANEKGMSYADFIISREQLSGISGEGTNEKIYNRIKRMNISKSEKEALWLSFYDDMTLEGKRIYF